MFTFIRLLEQFTFAHLPPQTRSARLIRSHGKTRDTLKLVRKVSRRQYGSTVYETERILVPIPAKDMDAAKPWLDRDLEIRLEQLSYGFAVLVTGGEWPYIGGLTPHLKFKWLMEKMEPKPE